MSSRQLVCPEGTPEQIASEIKTLISKVTPKAMGLIMGQVSTLVEIGNKKITTDFGVYFMDSHGTKHTYDCSGGECQCLFYLETNLPCWHLMLYRYTQKQDIFDAKSIPNKWLLDTLSNSFQVPVDNYGINTTSISKRDTQEKCLTELEKRVKASDLSKSLINVMVSCGSKAFSERVKVLESLEKCLRMGREIQSLFCFPAGKTCDQLDHLEFSPVNEEIDIDLGESHVVSGTKKVSGVEVNDKGYQESVVEDVRNFKQTCFGEGGSQKTELSYEGGLQFVRFNEGHSRQVGNDGDNTQVVKNCVKKPLFNLVKRISKKGRPKSAGKTVFAKKRKCTTQVISLFENPFMNVKQGTVVIDSSEDENDVHNTGLLQENTLVDNDDHIVCNSCGQKSVDSAICPQSDYCEMVMCDVCDKWYHEVCVTGNTKVHRGMKFKCQSCH